MLSLIIDYWCFVFINANSVSGLYGKAAICMEFMKDLMRIIVIDNTPGAPHLLKSQARYLRHVLAYDSLLIPYI